MNIESGLHSRNPFVRKGTALLLKAPKALARSRRTSDAMQESPPVMANSFPKSGTHLLDQIVSVLPGRSNYGAFLSSMTSSFRFRERLEESCVQYINATVPGEIVRAHLFFGEQTAAALKEMNYVHYFIYRDPRDVVLSGTHYVRDINRWHRLSSYFRKAESFEAAVNLSIEGFEDASNGVFQPDLAERFSRYSGWLHHPDVFCVRFEDLISERRDEQLQGMIEFYQQHSAKPLDSTAVLQRIKNNLIPQKSHTFRKGKAGGWREQYTADNREVFKRVAGDLLIELGYEKDKDW